MFLSLYLLYKKNVAPPKSKHLPTPMDSENLKPRKVSFIERVFLEESGLTVYIIICADIHS